MSNTHPTPEEIAAALEVLNRANSAAWEDAVSECFDGIDSRLEGLALLASALSRMSGAVEQDALALAEAHVKDADRSPDEALASLHRGLAYHHDVLACKAGVVGAHAELGLERWNDLEDTLRRAPKHMTEAQYDEASSDLI